MPAEGGIRFGQYVLQRRIARGGMAEVFLAQQHGLEGFDRRVAVKRILPHLASASDFIKMFLGEARLAAQLSHPNIVHIYDFGKVDADYFIAMEYVDGVHAGEMFRRAETDRMSPAMVARIGADAAAALHYAHELRSPSGQPYGLVHRDVSPANLMVSFDGVVKLCDFGIAKAVALGDRQLTSPGLVKGKYAYMSPEQTVGAPLDGRSDVYALAIVLWELLAGQLLVPRGDAVAAMRSIRNGKLTPIQQAAPWTPPALAEAITWALQTHREQRATAAQLAQTLEAFIKSSPEIATPMQLGGWLRARFPREPVDQAPSPGITQMSQRTPDEAYAPSRAGAASPRELAAASPGARGSIGSADTTSKTASLEEDDLGEAATLRAADPVGPRRPPRGGSGFTATVRATEAPVFAAPAASPAEPGYAPAPAGRASAREPRTGVESADPPGRASLPAGAPAPEERPSAVELDHGETLLRSGAFRPVVPNAQAALPTLLDPRPAPPPRTSPVQGFPAMAAQAAPPPRSTAMSPAARVAVLAAGMGALALLSFAVVLGVRSAHTNPAAQPIALAARVAPADAPPTPDTPPADAPPAVAAPVATGAPPDATAIDAAAATAALAVHTNPPGASVAIYRCPGSALENCRRARAADAAKVDGCASAPCSFALPIASYDIVVELDGASERRPVALTQDVTTSLDIVLKASPRSGRAAPTGTLTVHTQKRCEVTVDARRHLQTPIVDLELRPGPHKLELICGRRTITRSVTIASGKSADLTLPR